VSRQIAGTRIREPVIDPTGFLLERVGLEIGVYKLDLGDDENRLRRDRILASLDETRKG